MSETNTRRGLTVDDISDVVLEAQSVVGGERQDMYGTPERSFASIASVWTGLLMSKLLPGVVITPKDVTLLMTGLKLARETNKPKRDNLVDAHGYLLCADRVETTGS